jgi:hypothetical protein
MACTTISTLFLVTMLGVIAAGSLFRSTPKQRRPVRDEAEAPASSRSVTA